jgi:hypothetical protein
VIEIAAYVAGAILGVAALFIATSAAGLWWLRRTVRVVVIDDSSTGFQRLDVIPDWEAAFHAGCYGAYLTRQLDGCCDPCFDSHSRREAAGAA